MKQRLVIFTDLDGTLLDLETYSCQAAITTVQRLIALHIPLVFCSSKTRVEQEYYQRALEFSAPMIVENGAAIYIPEHYFEQSDLSGKTAAGYQVIEFGVPVSFIRQELQSIRTKLRLTFRGYAELSPGELCAITGLDTDAAIRAQQRDYSETLVGALSETEVAALTEALRDKGLSCTRGSRFYTVTSAHNDKGKAVACLTDLFRQHLGTITTIGLGDGANDLPMLRIVDRAFLLQQADSSSVITEEPQIERIAGTGAAVWARVIEHVLAETNYN